MSSEQPAAAATSRPLQNYVALVTGASRGIGKGIALQLGEAGAVVYITGRSLEASNSAAGGSLRETAAEIEKRGSKCIPVQCDHKIDADVEALFQRIKDEQNGRLDILVNNAYSAVGAITKNFGKPFWEQEVSMWDEVNNVGLRNHYICSVYAAQMMVARKSGLIVNISSGGGLRYLFNVAYGVGKAAVDRMACDMAVELQPHGVAVISLWPGLVKTEELQLASSSWKDGENAPKMDVDQGESTEFSGKAIVALAADKAVMNRTGKIHMTADLGDQYGFTDIDNRRIVSMRSVKAGLNYGGYKRLASYVPQGIRIPSFLFGLAGNKF